MHLTLSKVIEIETMRCYRNYSLYYCSGFESRPFRQWKANST